MTVFTDKTVLITGASAGIGLALAHEFGRKGARLVLTARRKERLDSLVADLDKAGVKAIAVAVDVTKDGDLETAADAARQAFGSIDVVVANAGFGVVGNIAKLSLDDYRRQFETNVFGVLRTIFATLEDLKKSRGHLVLIGSVNGYISTPATSPYCMSKHAIRALGESIHTDLARFGIRVTTIHPGFVASEIRQVDNSGRLHATNKDPVPSWLVMSAESAARQMVRAVAHGRREVVITGHGKVLVWAQRHVSGFVSMALAMGGKRGRPEPKGGKDN